MRAQWVTEVCAGTVCDGDGDEVVLRVSIYVGEVVWEVRFR